MTVKVKYDKEADAAWIRIASGKSAETVAATDSINLDFDSKGHLIAIEVLGVSKTAPALSGEGKTGLSVAAE